MAAVSLGFIPSESVADGCIKVLLGNVFNYGFGRNFDAHSGVPPDLAGVAGNMQCYVGRRCYVDRCVFDEFQGKGLALRLGLVFILR